MSGSLSESEVPVTPPELLTDRDRSAVAEIVELVANSRGQGCLYFGICNNRRKVTLLEAALAKGLSVHGIEIAQVVLAERHDQEGQPTYEILIADPVAYLDTNKPARPTLFLVHGLPDLIRAETANNTSGPAPVSQRLNYGRELFRREAICALFWTDPEITRYLAERARDFWSFRSGTEQFGDDLREEGNRPEGQGERQATVPGSRWMGDLKEKLDQLTFYRAKSPPDDSAIASLLLDIGRLRIKGHELQAALQALDEAGQIFERLGDRRRLSNVKTSLSRAYLQLGHLDRAESCARDALSLDSDFQDERSLSVDYSDLSQIYQARGELGEAEQWLRKAIAIEERLGNEPNLAIRYNNLSQIYKARGELGKAEQWLRKALALAEAKGGADTLATVKANLKSLRERQQTPH